MTAWLPGGARRPLVFAHRGGSGLAPENTMPAFERGLEAGADGIELDVRLSRDAVVMVHHDATVDRTTDGRGPVRNMTAVELERLDAGATFGGDVGHPFRGTGARIPRLDEVLRRFRDVPLIIELKGSDPDLALPVVRALREADAGARVCVGGYSARLLRAFRRAAPGIATSAAREEVRWALYRSWVGWPIRRVPYRAFQVPEQSGRTRVVSPRFVRAAHRAGLSVQVWTVDDPADIRRLLAWGVDGIITDRPDVAVRVRDREAAPVAV